MSNTEKSTEKTWIIIIVKHLKVPIKQVLNNDIKESSIIAKKPEKSTWEDDGNNNNSSKKAHLQQ